MHKLLCTRYSQHTILSSIDITIHEESKVDEYISKINSFSTPFTICLHLKDKSHKYNQYVSFFYHKIYPHLKIPFVLIIAAEDCTTPRQMDLRWVKSNINTINYLQTIINSKLLLHCYIENRDTELPKTSSLPLGMNPRELAPLKETVDIYIEYMNNRKPTHSRPLMCLFSCRIRTGPQWKDRKLINEYSQSKWKNFVRKEGGQINLSKESHNLWKQSLNTFGFNLCVHGGGIDPCPRLWESLCLGCIPIIKHSSMDDAFEGLPIAYVDDWNEDAITIEKLYTWQKELSPFFDDEKLFETWNFKLYNDYWITKIKSHLK